MEIVDKSKVRQRSEKQEDKSQNFENETGNRQGMTFLGGSGPPGLLDVRGREVAELRTASR